MGDGEAGANTWGCGRGGPDPDYQPSLPPSCHTSETTEEDRCVERKESSAPHTYFLGCSYQESMQNRS